MIIKHIAVWDNRPEFSDGPFVMAHATQSEINGRIVAITLDSGQTGLGEIIFAPSISFEDISTRIVDEQSILAVLIGQKIEAVNCLCQELSTRDASWRAVAFGLETAYLDLQAQVQNCALSELLGGACVEAVPDYFAISEKSPERIRQRMAIAGPDRKIIQLKLGSGSQANDVEQLELVLELMNENQIMLADANGGWDSQRALETITAFDDDRIHWEEPCSNYEDNVGLVNQCGARVMVDQCVGQRTSVTKAILEGVVNSVCIKPAFLGGLSIARDMLDLCVEHDMQVRIDGPYCTDIANAAILHLAVGVPAHLLIASCDLREPLAIEHELNGVIGVSNGIISPPSGPGLGTGAVVGSLGAPESVYSNT